MSESSEDTYARHFETNLGLMSSIWSSASNVMSDIQQPFLLLSFVVVGFLYLEHQYIPGERFESKVLFLLWCLVRLFGFHLPSSL